MKRAFAVIISLTLVLTGCYSRNLADLTDTEAFQINSHPPTSTEVTKVTEGMDAGPTVERLIPTETETTSGKEDSTETTDPVEKPTVPSSPSYNPSTPSANEEQQRNDPPQETATVSPTSAPADPVPPTQAETAPSESTNPETEPTEPETTPTVPPTEPSDCTHEWKCIHHAEEGHWRAGIICDCGWTVYGLPEELTALWNAHSASFAPAEALFDHGGFGSMDEWIVDKPAFDEWVCRHCGEAKE